MTESTKSCSSCSSTGGPRGAPLRARLSIVSGGRGGRWSSWASGFWRWRSLSQRSRSRDATPLRWPRSARSPAALPFESEQFDIVLSFKTTHHVPDWLAALREIGLTRATSRSAWRALRWLCRSLLTNHFSKRDIFMVCLQCLVTHQGARASSTYPAALRPRPSDVRAVRETPSRAARRSLGVAAADFVETEAHLLVTIAWCRPERPKDQVPDWEDRPEIAVRLELPGRVMDTVQVGCHDEVTQNQVAAERYTDVDDHGWPRRAPRPALSPAHPS